MQWRDAWLTYCRLKVATAVTNFLEKHAGMPILNVNQINDKYDTVIIGSGPAGCSIAHLLSLSRPDLTILLVEAGLEDRDKNQSFFSSITATGDLPSEYYPQHSRKIFGGGSSIWNGYCAPMEKRAFLAGEWPLEYEELERFYPIAAEILELPSASYEAGTLGRHISDDIVYRPFYLSPPVRFYEKYFDVLIERPNLHIALGCTCKTIRHSGATVESITLETGYHETLSEKKVHPQKLVLAAGGLGNPALLLANNIGLHSPVGKFFSEHPHIYQAGTLILDKDIIDDVILKNAGQGIVHALQLSDKFCLQGNILSSSVSFDLSDISEHLLLGERRPSYVSNAIVRSEMPMLASNQISLLHKEKLEDIRVNLEFQYTDMARKCWEHFSRMILANGIGRCSEIPVSVADITGGGHYIGTTRMGISLHESVVDMNCKVHDIDNLYLAGSSVFSAAGAANPTFTIVALAARLADHFSKST